MVAPLQINNVHTALQPFMAFDPISQPQLPHPPQLNYFHTTSSDDFLLSCLQPESEPASCNHSREVSESENTQVDTSTLIQHISRPIELPFQTPSPTPTALHSPQTALQEAQLDDPASSLPASQRRRLVIPDSDTENGPGPLIRQPSHSDLGSCRPNDVIPMPHQTPSPQLESSSDPLSSSPPAPTLSSRVDHSVAAEDEMDRILFPKSQSSDSASYIPCPHKHASGSAFVSNVSTSPSPQFDHTAPSLSTTVSESRILIKSEELEPTRAPSPDVPWVRSHIAPLRESAQRHYQHSSSSDSSMEDYSSEEDLPRPSRKRKARGSHKLAPAKKPALNTLKNYHYKVDKGKGGASGTPPSSNSRSKPRLSSTFKCVHIPRTPSLTLSQCNSARRSQPSNRPPSLSSSIKKPGTGRVSFADLDPPQSLPQVLSRSSRAVYEVQIHDQTFKAASTQGPQRIPPSSTGLNDNATIEQVVKHLKLEHCQSWKLVIGSREWVSRNGSPTKGAAPHRRRQTDWSVTLKGLRVFPSHEGLKIIIVSSRSHLLICFTLKILIDFCSWV